MVFKGNRYLKIGLLSAGLFLCIFALISLFIFGNIFTFFMVLPWIANYLEASIGLNIWLARSIAAVLAVIFISALALAFSFNRTKRNVGYIFMACIVSIFCVSMYYMEKDLLFTANGETSKCYSVGIYGEYEIVPCSWNVNPKNGREVKKLTPKIATIIKVQREGLHSVKRINPSKDMVFFTPDGKAIVWYYLHPDGKLEFFAYPGSHPQLGVTLNPVNTEIVLKLFDYLDKGKYEMIVVNNKKTVRTNHTSDFGNNNLGELVKLKETLEKIMSGR